MNMDCYCYHWTVMEEMMYRGKEKGTFLDTVLECCNFICCPSSACYVTPTSVIHQHEIRQPAHMGTITLPTGSTRSTEDDRMTVNDELGMSQKDYPRIL